MNIMNVMHCNIANININIREFLPTSYILFLNVSIIRKPNNIVININDNINVIVNNDVII